VIYQDQEPEILLQALRAGARDVVATEDPDHMQLVVKREFNDLLVRRELKRTLAALRETEARCATLINNSRDAIAYIHEGMHILANPAYLEMFGHQDMEALEGLPILDMIAADDHNKFKGFLRTEEAGQSQLEVRCQHSGGETFDALLEFSAASIDGESCTQITIRDTTQQDAHLKQKLDQISNQDPQTGLSNRQHFFAQINEAIVAKGGSKEKDWLFYIVIDDFQQIRSSTGIAASDIFLKGFAAILKGIAEDRTLLARFGDHTFTMLLKGGSAAEAVALSKTIHHRVQEHDFSAEAGVLDQTCSIGITRLNSDTSNGQEAVNHAYHACEKARGESRNNTSFYDEQAMQPGSEEAGNEASLNQLIQHALENDRFRLVYQPIVSLQGESRETYAVLTRLIDNNDEEILPEYFMKVAEQSGQMETGAQDKLLRHSFGRRPERRKPPALDL
jgi:diguanylate cyclase (GGDEF)-like protein/PAS domain S-box-containing protein